MRFERSCRLMIPFWSTRFAQVAGLLIALSASGCGGQSATYKQPPQDKLVFDARAAAESGDKQKALELYDQSIAAKPTDYGYFERGKLQASLGNTAAATEDCQKGLELNPLSTDLKWLQAELKKPPAAQFKGKNAEPPKVSK